MPEIQVLPVRLPEPEHLDRLTKELAVADAQDRDLGPRLLHIQAGGERLLELSRLLEHAIEDLDLSLTELNLQDPATREALRSIVSATRGLADKAQRFPPNL